MPLVSALAGLREQVAAYTAGFDPSACTVEQCREVLAEAAVIERMAATVKAQAAARVAESGSWRADGGRSAAHDLAVKTGTTVGAAREALQTGTALQQLPVLAQAARRGELSPTQTASIASVGAVAPELVPELIGRAQNTTVAELREECARRLAARQPDPEGARQRVHDERSMRSWADPSGARVLQIKDAPDVIAGLYVDMAPTREALFAQARERGETIRPDALDVDALVATVRAGREGNVALARSGPRSAGTPHKCSPRAKC